MLMGMTLSSRSMERSASWGHLTVARAREPRGGQMIRSVAVGLLVALLSSPPLGKAACSSNVSSFWQVSDTASATALAEAVANCPGGEIDVEWSGSVPINRTIDVGNGTVLRITGVYGTSSEVDGCGSSELFFVSNASLHVSDVTISNGNASFGAGAVTALSSVITFSNTSFVNNVGKTGGAVCAMSRSNVTWNDASRFVENTGLTSGGAVFANGSSALSWAGRATFVQNQCDGYPCNGGAVHLDNGSTATWEGEATFFQNSADGFGGAVYSKESSVSWKAVTTFTDNSALYNGGAAHLNRSNAVWEEEVSFESNFADGFAGAVSAHESTNVTWESDVLYYNNTACRYAGAVLVANESRVTWAGETHFFENSADLNGGALFASYSSELTLSGTTEFRSNYAVKLGGAVGSLLSEESEESSVLTINGSTTFANNSCGESGGAMFVGGSFSVVFETSGVLFINNSAAAYGGALFITGVGIGLEVEGVRFVSNAAQVGGAAAVTSSGNDLTKEGNGNALQENPTTFRGCTFTENFADATGGAIYSAAGEDYMVDTVFSGNVAGVGGAMRLAGTSTLENCSFVDNSSEENEGPAVSNIGFMNVTNCLFEYNVFNCEEGYYLHFNTSLVAFDIVCDGCDTECKGCTPQAKTPFCTSAIDYTESLGGQNTIEMLLIDDGYWRATNTSINIFECYNQDACLGGVTGSADYCAEGYEGPYCSVCSYGYVSTFGSKCSKCSDRDSGIALAAVVAAFALVACAMFLVYMMSAQLGGAGGKLLAVLTKRTPMQTIKIIIVAWQILTQFAEIAYLTYPGIYGDFLDLVNVLNFDVSWVLNTGCVMETDFHDKLAIVTIGPIACLAILGATYAFAAAHMHRADHDALNTVRHKHLSAVLLLTYLVYSSVSSTLFQMFACEDLDDGKEYLRADYRIECTSAKHKALQLYAGFMIALYPVGIPLFYSVLLFRYRDVLAGENARERDERVRPTSELWKPYKPGCFFYEVVECMRRILLTGAVVFIYPRTPQAQIAVTLMMAVLFVFVSEILSPYASNWDAWASRAGHAIVFSSLYLGLLMEVDVSSENGSGAFEVILVVANVSLIVAVVIESIMISVALREGEKNDAMVQIHPRPRQCTDSSSYASALD